MIGKTGGIKWEKEAFREGIQEYLKTYAYANATWDDLIQILDSKTEQDLAALQRCMGKPKRNADNQNSKYQTNS